MSYRAVLIKQQAQMRTIDSGDHFIRAWFDVVFCHAFLWKNHIEYGDLSPNNMAYDAEHECGLLIDVDWALLRCRRRVIGTDRIGTIPLLALDLLREKYFNGKIKRYYHHELESFFWIVPYTFLAYRRKNATVHEWRTSDYVRCRVVKGDLLYNSYEDAVSTIRDIYKDHHEFMFRLHLWVILALTSRGSRLYDRQQEGSEDVGLPLYVEDSDHMWQKLIALLETLVENESYHKFADAVTKLKSFNPNCKPLSAEDKTNLTQEFAQFMVGNSVSSSS